MAQTRRQQKCLFINRSWQVNAVLPLFLFCLMGMQTSAADTEIYISATKRHQGVSRFDVLPVTDRVKGDPDRYRAVNPRYVRRDNGQYYFLLDVPTNTVYRDENLMPQGVLPAGQVWVELTRTKTARNRDGKTMRYVFVQNRGYIKRDSLPSSDTIKRGRWFHFPIKTGTRLYDGRGIVRGTVTVRTVRLNYGQQKMINGQRYLYAFSTTIVGTSGKRLGASGWIAASDLEAGNDPAFTAETVAKNQPLALTVTTFTRYELTGGNPQELTKQTADSKPQFRFGYRDATGRFISYKVLPGVPLAGRESIAAADYLKRSDGVVNLGFNVAGVSNDTYRVSRPQQRLFFFRASVPDATAIIELFPPKDATNDGTHPIAWMTFVYGYVDEGPTKRWGWLPLAALQPSPAEP